MFPLCKGGTHNGGSGQKLNQRLLEYEGLPLGEIDTSGPHPLVLEKPGSVLSSFHYAKSTFHMKGTTFA